jgi:hypothetical protein
MRVLEISGLTFIGSINSLRTGVTKGGAQKLPEEILILSNPTDI